MRGDWPNTALSLEEWRQVFGWHPYHFWGMADNDILAVTAQCDEVVYGYAWQDNQIIGRFEITEAIARAEQKLADYLHYRPGPIYTEAAVTWPAAGDPRMIRGSVDAQGRWLSVDLPEGEIRAIGTELRTLIGNTAVSLIDADGDNINDRFSATIATTVTDVTEIACYFIAADRLNGDEVSERYRIRPLDVQISAGTATIRGPAWLLTRPINSEGFRMAPKDPASAGVLATSIAVYQRTTNASSTAVATSQAVITWETRPCHGWWCCCGCQSPSPFGGSPYDPAATAQAVARAGIRNARLGTVFAADAAYDATTGIWSALDWAVCTQPDTVTVRYLAGKALVNFRMDPTLTQVVAHLAAAEMERPICSCEVANRAIDHWQLDLAYAGPGKEVYQVSQTDLDNPFGTRRGHVEAWRYVTRQQRLRGTTI